MGILDSFKKGSLGVGSQRTQSMHPAEPEYLDDSKDLTEETNTALNTGDSDDDSSLKQDGVKKAQATTIVWSRNALVVAYCLIFLIFFSNSLGQQTSNNVLRYVTSSFDQLSLTATTGIVSQLVAGVIKLPVAKLMDVWGRPQGYLFMLFCAVIGLIMMAATNGVSLYAAAQVFYWVGENGIAYVLDVFIADTSSLKWRGLMFAFSTSPYIATSFAGPAAASAYLKGPGWRWVYGTWSIVTPALSLPFLWVFWKNQRLARKQGVLVDKREASGRTTWQSIVHYFVEFDVIGIVLLVAGWALLLLPISLANTLSQSWRSATIIAMLVVGFCLLVSFGVWERFFARKSFLPFHYLKDRTVIGSCLTAAGLFISFYCWDYYFTSFLQAVYSVSIADAGYIYQIYSIGSSFWSIVVGLLIPATGRFKWLAICGALLQTLGTGLMIYFRHPGRPLGYVIMCQIFIAFGGGTIVVTQQIAIMAAVGPENVAVALALQALFTAIGGSIGTAISGAIFTNTMARQLQENLPANLKSQAVSIAGSLTTQLEYPVGSPARNAIIKAYGVSQTYMCIAGTASLAIMLFGVFIWRDIRVEDFKKPKGAKIV